jgi:cytochrome c oxidase assembly protein subunit 15
VLLAVAAALLVILLGAYTRLTDAGLGCPDWPGCYGQLTVPSETASAADAEESSAVRRLDRAKAWTEMVHRYAAGMLGLLLLALAVASWLWGRKLALPVLVPTLLLGVVVLQALLGMWTVTLLLKPVVVTGHLLGGFATLALLWWLALRVGALPSGDAGLMGAAQARSLRPWAALALALVSAQVALGGWTSANYAALACPDFPLCQGAWWPPMDFREAFVLWRGTGVSYEFGVLDNEARVAIHVAHRIGAFVTAIYLTWLAIGALRARRVAGLSASGAVLLLLVALQLTLGITNVVLSLPLPVAVAHNGTAALILLTVVTINHLLNPLSRIRIQYATG